MQTQHKSSLSRSAAVQVPSVLALVCMTRTPRAGRGRRLKESHAQMNEKEYNGWTNYETWLVKLWQDNDQGEQSFWQDMAEEYVKEYGKENGNWKFADAMKDHYSERASELADVTGFWADLLNASLSEVNWGEIAHAWVEEVEVEDETEAAHD